MNNATGLGNDLETNLSKGPADNSKSGESSCQPIQERMEEAFNSIDRFAWDQTADVVKVYVNLEGLASLPSDSTSARFEERSAELVVRNLRQRNYCLKLRPLYAPIDSEKSTFSVKRDRATLRLAKSRRGEHWLSVTQPTEQKNAMPKPDPSGDPSESIMNMMKNLYNQGDSEMKRTIAKAWTESQERKMKGLPADDGVF